MTRSIPVIIAIFSLALLSLGYGAALTSAEPKQSHAAGFAYEEVVRGDPAAPGMKLLIALHYSGGTPKESFENYDGVRGPVRIIVPLGAYQKREGFSYFPPDYYQLAPAAQRRIARDTAAKIADFVAHMASRHRIKPVLTGISQGGDLSLLVALYHPSAITAALPFAAVLTFEMTQIGTSYGMAIPPIHMFQGDADPIIDVATTRRHVAMLAQSAPVTLKTYRGLGHDISPAMKRDYTALLDQLLNAEAAKPSRDR